MSYRARPFARLVCLLASSWALAACARGGLTELEDEDAPAHTAPDDAGEGQSLDAEAARDAQAPAQGRDGATVPEGDAAPAARDAATPVDDAMVNPTPECVSGSALYALGTVAAPGEHALRLRAQSSVDTRWGTKGNEAVVLEVLADGHLVGHLVLHQGTTPFDYTMHLGALAAGARVDVRMSTLSAPSTTAEACVESAALLSAAELGDDARALANAPVFLWPVQKRFDDLPLLVGFSSTLGRYEVVYSNENGGTTTNCGGGSKGIQALVARWGRAADVEAAYDIGKSPAEWQRCSGRTHTGSHALRYEAQHPLLYYGDGHNRLFESRGGYGQSCGSGGAERADGNLTGFNAENPGNDASLDDAYVLRLRPLPVSLDAIPEYLSAPQGRREALIDHYAPWLYRLTFEELAREGKIDNARTFGMGQYVFIDVQADDVGGQGDNYCATVGLKSGFKLRLLTKDGKVLAGPQITADYFAGPAGWKRVAFPLDRVYQPDELAAVQFDAFDNDGVYFLALGDAFMPVAEGPNGATLRYLHRGLTSVGVYSDDDSSGCTAGVNHDGPAGGPAAGYPCVGSSYDVPMSAVP